VNFDVMSFDVIDRNALAYVIGGDSFPGESIAASGVDAAGNIAAQWGTAIINNVLPTVVRSAAGGLSSLLQSIMFGGSAPLGDMMMGVVKGMGAEIGGPVGVNSFPQNANPHK
jgi:hypothetical protein